MAVVGAKTCVVQVVGAIGDIKALVNVSATGANQSVPSVVAPAAKAGTLTTRTSDTAGVATSTAHGLAGTETLGLFWAGGYRYGVAIDSHDADTVTFSGGAGSNLPVADTVIRIAVAQSITGLSIVGSSLLGLFLYSSGSSDYGLGVLKESGGTVRLASTVTDTAAYIWPQSAGASVPFSQTVTILDFYNGAIGASTMSAMVLQ
jgi:hypothetical protein